MINKELVSDRKLERVTNLILENRRPPGKDWFWPINELKGKPLDKKRANKFLLCGILDYQIKTERALENAKRLSIYILGDPKDLWNVIAEYSEKEWMSKFHEYKLHRFPAAHKRVWRISREMVNYYNGDARKLWDGKSPSEVIDEFKRIRLGDNISRMCVGGLLDTKQIKGKGDVKADIHLKRVVGRVVEGEPIKESRVIAITRMMYPKNPWMLDREFWFIGKELCHSSNPNCHECYLRTECIYSKN